MTRARWLLALLLALPGAGWAGEPAAPVAPLVIAVDAVSAAPLPGGLVQAALLPMTGAPRSRDAIRESLERLWSLGLFSAADVEEVLEPGGVRLRFRLVRKPYVEQIAWRGAFGLAVTELAATAALPLDGDAGPRRLEEARERLLARYAAEGYFGAAIRVVPRTDPATGATVVTFIVAAGQRARLGAVSLEGLGRFPARTVRRALGLSAGRRYTEAAVREGVRAAEERMRDAGFYAATVRADPPAWDRAANAVRLAIRVSEGPEYRVELTGRLALRAAALRKALPFSASGIVDEFAVESAARLLTDLYRERGYHFAAVQGTLVPDTSPQQIRFAIDPGPRVRVRQVAFDGNRVFRDAHLRGLIQTRAYRTLRGGYYAEATLARDLRVLLAFYRAQGMVDSTVGPPDVRFSADRREATVRIPIEEGTLVRVGAITVEGATVVGADTIIAALPVRSAGVWSPASTEEARRAVAALYAHRGYVHAEVAIREARRDDRVDLTVELREGERTRVSRVLVSGLVDTRERVVRRELAVAPAQPFDPGALQETERRLADLGIFERIAVGPLQPPPAPFADATLALQEAKPWHLDLGAGYSTDEGLRGTLELGNDNLFGTGRRASLRGRISGIEDSGRLTLHDPRLLGAPWQLTTELYGVRREEIGYRLERVGGTTEVGRDLPRSTVGKLHVALRYRLEWARRSDVNPALLTEAVEPGSELIGSLRPALTVDRRNDPVNPTRGSFHSVSLEGAGAPLGSEVTFLKSEVGTTWFVDWPPPTVLALGARLGLAGTFAGTPDLPVQERFFAGGETTIRGYARDQVGPRDAAGNPRGGQARVLLNAEWRFPIWRLVGGALFVDAGTVRRELVDLRLSEFKVGVGAGLRLNTPVGPVRFDVGYGLNPIPTKDRLNFYFSVGYPF